MTKNNILNFIFKAYKDNRMFESLMIESNNEINAMELLNDIVRFLYCNNHSLIDDECSSCKELKSKKISDLKIIGNGTESINKEKVANLINDFSISSKEQGKPKVAIISNAEDLKKDAANSLLKFLEEPVFNTYIFLITRNKNNVLPTIKSRVKLFTLEESQINGEDNYVVKIIKSKNKDNILLMNNKMKKQDKSQLILDLQIAMNKFLNLNDMNIYELILNLIEDVKFSNNTNLAIDNFVIKVVKIINESN